MFKALKDRFTKNAQLIKKYNISRDDLIVAENQVTERREKIVEYFNQPMPIVIAVGLAGTFTQHATVVHDVSGGALLMCAVGYGVGLVNRAKMFITSNRFGDDLKKDRAVVVRAAKIARKVAKQQVQPA